MSSAVPDAAALGFAAETAPPSAVFFLGARLRRRLFFSVLAAPPPGGAVAPSPSEAAARFRANVGVRRVICGPGVRARRGATGATTRADIPVAPLVLPGLAPCMTRACEAAACAIMTDGALRWCRDAVCRPAEQGGGLLPPRSYPALHSRVAHGSAEVLLTLHTSKGREYLLLKVLNSKIIMIKRVYTSHQEL